MTTLFRLAVGAALLAAGPLAAQSDERTDVQLRNDCRLAAQIIRTGNPAPHREWAYATITRCSETGPAVVADAWREPPTEERVIQQLIGATAKFRTRQVFASVAGAAQNGQNSRTLRTYAFAMLYSFARPGRSLSVQDLLRPRGDRPARIYTASGDGGIVNAPDLGDVQTEVRALLSAICASDQDEEIVRTAQAVLERV